MIDDYAKREQAFVEEVVFLKRYGLTRPIADVLDANTAFASKSNEERDAYLRDKIRRFNEMYPHIQPAVCGYEYDFGTMHEGALVHHVCTNIRPCKVHERE